MNLQLARDVAPVSDDGIDGDEELRSYLLVRHALDQADDDFLLAFGYRLRALCVSYHI